MTDEFNIALNVTLPRDLAISLGELKLPNIKIESVSGTCGEDAARFGIAEAAVALVLIKGSLEMVKLCIEIRNLLRERKQQTGDAHQVVVLSSPIGSTSMQITARQSDDEIETAVSKVYNTH